jgi:hypothetical protein
MAVSRDFDRRVPMNCSRECGRRFDGELGAIPVDDQRLSPQPGTSH